MLSSIVVFYKRNSNPFATWYALFSYPHTPLVIFLHLTLIFLTLTIPARPPKSSESSTHAPAHFPALSLKCSWATERNRMDILRICGLSSLPSSPHRARLQEQLGWSMLTWRTLPKEILPQHSNTRRVLLSTWQNKDFFVPCLFRR